MKLFGLCEDLGRLSEWSTIPYGVDVEQEVGGVHNFGEERSVGHDDFGRAGDRILYPLHKIAHRTFEELIVAVDVTKVDPRVDCGAWDNDAIDVAHADADN